MFDETKKIKMKGKEAETYAIWIRSLEPKADSRPKYIATIMPMIPIMTVIFKRKPKKIEEAAPNEIDQSNSVADLD